MKTTYTVCHDCQLTGGGITNCAHADTCGAAKTYPAHLRKLVERCHQAEIPLSIIAEKSFDLGQEYANQATDPIISSEEIFRDFIRTHHLTKKWEDYLQENPLPPINQGEDYLESIISDEFETHDCVHVEGRGLFISVDHARKAVEYANQATGQRERGERVEELPLAEFELIKKRYNCHDYDLNDVLLRAFQLGQSKQGVSNWISVEVENPPVGKVVLLYHSTQLCQITGFYSGESFYYVKSHIHTKVNLNELTAYSKGDFNIYDYAPKNITHWQPLPPNP